MGECRPLALGFTRAFRRARHVLDAGSTNASQLLTGCRLKNRCVTGAALDPFAEKDVRMPSGVV
jgi:hypothetical protein